MIRAELGISGGLVKDTSSKPTPQLGFWLGQVLQRELDALQAIREIAYENTVNKVNAFLKFKGLEEEFANFRLPQSPQDNVNNIMQPPKP